MFRTWMPMFPLRSDESHESVEFDEPNEPDESVESNVSAESDESVESEESNEPHESKELYEPDEHDHSGEPSDPKACKHIFGVCTWSDSFGLFRRQRARLIQTVGPDSLHFGTSVARNLLCLT